MEHYFVSDCEHWQECVPACSYRLQLVLVRLGSAASLEKPSGGEARRCCLSNGNRPGPPRRIPSQKNTRHDKKARCGPEDGVGPGLVPAAVRTADPGRGSVFSGQPAGLPPTTAKVAQGCGGGAGSARFIATAARAGRERAARREKLRRGPTRGGRATSRATSRALGLQGELWAAPAESDKPSV